MLIHTSVSDDYRGQGIAEALIKLVVKQVDGLHYNGQKR